MFLDFAVSMPSLKSNMLIQPLEAEALTRNPTWTSKDAGQITMQNNKSEGSLFYMFFRVKVSRNPANPKDCASCFPEAVQECVAGTFRTCIS